MKAKTQALSDRRGCLDTFSKIQANFGNSLQHRPRVRPKNLTPSPSEACPCKRPMIVPLQANRKSISSDLRLKKNTIAPSLSLNTEEPSQYSTLPNWDRKLSTLEDRIGPSSIANGLPIKEQIPIAKKITKASCCG